MRSRRLILGITILSIAGATWAIAEDAVLKRSHISTDQLIVHRPAKAEIADSSGSVQMYIQALPDQRVKLTLMVPGHDPRVWIVKPEADGRMNLDPTKEPVTLDCKTFGIVFDRPSE